MRVMAATHWATRCWIALVIFSLARLPLPFPDLHRSGLVAHDASSALAIDDPSSTQPDRPWQWRWVTLCPGSFCPISLPAGSGLAEGDCDRDECEAEAEFLPSGRPRWDADPFGDPAFDATPASHPARTPKVPSPGAKGGLIATFSPGIPRPALLQRWIC